MVSERLVTSFLPFATKPETTNLSLLQQLSIVDDYLVARLRQRVSISGTHASIGGTTPSAWDCF
jgi:hypothetical protein